MTHTRRSPEHENVTTRRRFLVSLAAVAAVPELGAQSRRPQIAARTVNHVALAVSDIQRSLAFYQDLFGLWNYAPSEAAPLLRIGSGPHFLGLRTGAPEETGGLSHLCLGVDGFDAGEIMETLAAHGVARVERAGTEPRTAWARMRAGTPQVFFNDPNGILVQLQDLSYCGGSGPIGAVCPPRPREQMIRPSRAPVRLHTINHVILAVSDPAGTRQFWQELCPPLFGNRANRGGAAGNQRRRGNPPPFIGFVQGGAAAPRLDHLCFGLENFEAAGVMRRLLDFGLKEQIGGTVYGLDGPPLSARAFARSGAPDNSNAVVAVEVYVTDPDSITLQLNDVNYCSGYGRLGSQCS